MLSPLVVRPSPMESIILLASCPLCAWFPDLPSDEGALRGTEWRGLCEVLVFYRAFSFPRGVSVARRCGFDTM